MLRIHKDTEVPRYVNGNWNWDEDIDNVVFDARDDMQMVKADNVITNGFMFRRSMDELEEMIFRKEFTRPENSHDAEVIVVQDIINVVLFLSPKQFLNIRFVNFMHTKVVVRLMRALVIYFDYFLKVAEFLLIRRDDTTGRLAQLQTSQSIAMKRTYSANLSQYRLMVAREYAEILKGDGELAPYHHVRPIVNISQTEKDQKFHEHFLAVATQFVWIAMHRRSYDVIDAEMGRLFRTEHFQLTPPLASFNLSHAETSLLYGKAYKRVNSLITFSPLINELQKVGPIDRPILWIGERKYRGTDNRIHQMELEYIVPESQLVLIDAVQGILGHPKKLYNTTLNISWRAVRDNNFTEIYDPYRLIRQPELKVPLYDTEKLRRHAKTYESYFMVQKHLETVPLEQQIKWTKRTKVIQMYKDEESLLTSVMTVGAHEALQTDYGRPQQEIIQTFMDNKKKLRKN